MEKLYVVKELSNVCIVMWKDGYILNCYFNFVVDDEKWDM